MGSWGQGISQWLATAKIPMVPRGKTSFWQMVLVIIGTGVIVRKIIASGNTLAMLAWVTTEWRTARRTND